MINPTARSPWVGLQDRVRWLLMRQWDEKEFRYIEFRAWQSPDEPDPVSAPPWLYVDGVVIL